MAEHFRRIDPRYDRQLEIEVLFEGKKQTSQTRNISLGGLYLESAAPLPIGTTVQLRFLLPTQPEPVEVAGDVRWVVKKGAGDRVRHRDPFPGTARPRRLGAEPLLPERLKRGPARAHRRADRDPLAQRAVPWLAWAIGADGIRLEQAAPLERGRPVEVRFALPDDEALTLRAVIADDEDDPDHDERSRELTFLSPPEEARAAINRYVRARLELPE